LELHGVDALFQTVVDGGFCIGCGVCAGSSPDKLTEMRMDAFGRIQPVRVEPSPVHEPTIDVLRLCPFSNEAPDEDDISQALFEGACQKHPLIGYYSDCLAAHVVEGDFRARGSSGGLATWLLTELLISGTVDAILHVRPRTPDSRDPRLFAYAVSSSVEEVRAGARSHYYPVEVSQVLQHVLAHDMRYAFVGIPCFVKAVRLAMEQNAMLKHRIKHCVGIFCGHLKSAAYADSLAWQCGIPPGRLTAISFRRKIPERKASDYGMAFEGIVDGRSTVKEARSAELYGGDWGLGFFKYQACDYCDDVTAETADVAIGDAWLPGYVDDSQGTSIVVVRNTDLGEMLNRGVAEGRVSAQRIGPDVVALSQRGGFRHRRQGLSYRLYLAEKRGGYCPRKRVPPNSFRHDRRFQNIQGLRPIISQLSHYCWADASSSGVFERFVECMGPVVQLYNDAYATKPSLLWRLPGGVWRRLVQMFRSA